MDSTSHGTNKPLPTNCASNSNIQPPLLPKCNRSRCTQTIVFTFFALELFWRFVVFLIRCFLSRASFVLIACCVALAGPAMVWCFCTFAIFAFAGCCLLSFTNASLIVFNVLNSSSALEFGLLGFPASAHGVATLSRLWIFFHSTFNRIDASRVDVVLHVFRRTCRCPNWMLHCPWPNFLPLPTSQLLHWNFCIPPRCLNLHIFPHVVWSS